MDSIINSYKKSGLFEYVEENFKGIGSGFQLIPNDPYFTSQQWCQYNDGGFSPNSVYDADMDTDEAWNITQGDSELIVAILDTGVKLDHPEFSERIWINNSEFVNGIDSDWNGYVDDNYGGWDFVNNDNEPIDDHGHGTHVTGIALAEGNNNIGYAGVNWNSKIMICKVLDMNNTGWYSDWADAVYYAVDNGADVINMSLIGYDSSYLLQQAIMYANSFNVPVVVSAGNDNAMTLMYPAQYSDFSVGSTDSDDSRSSAFSGNISSGSNAGLTLDFVAPGNFIYGLSHLSNTNSAIFSGTSMAAPQLTGLISLLLSINPNLTISELQTILQESSEDQVGDSDDTEGWDMFYGHGRINAFSALSYLVEQIASFTENNTSSMKGDLIKKIDILGRDANSKGFNIEIYDDGSVEKKYVIE